VAKVSPRRSWGEEETYERGFRKGSPKGGFGEGIGKVDPGITLAGFEGHRPNRE